MVNKQVYIPMNMFSLHNCCYIILIKCEVWLQNSLFTINGDLLVTVYNTFIWLFHFHEMNQPTKIFLCDTNSTTTQMNEDKFNKIPSGNSVTWTFCSGMFPHCSFVKWPRNLNYRVGEGGRQGGNVIFLFWPTAALIWGLYGPKLQSLKGNKDKRRRTMTVWGQMLTQCSCQPSELARLYF